MAYDLAPVTVPATHGASWEEITSWYTQLRSEEGDFQRQMQSILDHYNGEIVVPLLDVKGEPEVIAAVPALVADAVDGMAMRATTVRPQIIVPSVDRTSSAANARAQLRQRAYSAIWQDQGINDVLARAAYRFVAAYGTGNYTVLPDFKRECAVVEARNPIGIYPDFRNPHDFCAPNRVIQVYSRSVAWIRARFPQTPLPRGARPTDIWEVVEYVDPDCIVIGVAGPRLRSTRYGGFANEWPAGGVEVIRWQNLAGVTPIAQPNRVTLDRVAGQVASMIAIVKTMSRMMALDIVAAEKAIFGDMVIIGKEGEEPKLLSGAWKDGRTGEPNLVTDAEVKVLQSGPGPMTDQMLNRLERAARSHGGDPAMAGGELSHAVRSGSTIDAMAGMAIDPKLQEAQELMARGGFTVLNEAIAAVNLAYFPKKRQKLISGWTSDAELVEFVPEEIWSESTTCMVRYPFPGVDAQRLSVGITQLVGAELMSRKSARIHHPWIEDADIEEQTITEERIRSIVLEAFTQQGITGALPLIDISRILELFMENGDLVKSIIQANKEAQDRQAATPPPPEPGMGMAPEQAPGLSMPGMGAETQAPPTVPPLSPSLGNARELFNALSAKIR